MALSGSNTGGMLAFRNDRLGGRLNAILTAYRIAQKYNVPFRMFWPAHDDTSIELRTPEDLFDPNFMEEVFLTHEEGGKAVRAAQDIGGLYDMTEAEFEAAIKNGTWFLSNSATEQQILSWETRDVLSEIPKILHEFPFSSVVKKMIKEIEQTLGDVDFQSYHLRRGDIIDDNSLASHNSWSNKYIPRVIYEWHMKRELERDTGKIVVFSDTPQETAAFCAMSERVLSFDDLIKSDDLTILQRDFLELYVMSRSQKIFAPPSSAFSGIAAALGNIEVTDITLDITPEMHQEAMNELTDRVENRPDAFLSQSDLAQNFPFVLHNLAIKAENDRARKMLRQHIERGVDRAFVYPLLAHRLLADGDFDGFAPLIEAMRKRPCVREEHASMVYAYAAVAEIVKKDWEKAKHYYHIASWFAPLNGLVNEVFWYLDVTGHITPSETYDYDPRLMRKAGRIFKEDEPAFADLMRPLREEKVQLRQYPAELNIRDWRKIQGKKLNFSFNRRDKILRQAEAISRFFKNDIGAAFALSAEGALLSEAENFKEGGSLLKKAVDLEPENALFLKRLSDHELRKGKLDKSIDLLKAATTLSGHNECYLAELATRLLSAKRQKEAAEVMRKLQNQKPKLIEVRLLIIDYMRRDSETLAQVPAMLDELSQVAPGSHRIAAIKAKALEQMNQFDESLAIIRELKQLGRQDTIIRSKVKTLADRYTRVHSPKKTKKWMKASGIKKNYDLK